MSILEMKVPSPGESITEVEISSWLVKDGDFVEKDQPIAEVDSDKATLELPAEESGVITLKAEEGDVVKVGQVVCLIDMSAQGSAVKTEKPASEMKVEAQTVAAPVQEPKKEESHPSSPLAKVILKENSIDSDKVTGTGVGGKITKEDAIKAVAAMGRAQGNRKQTVTKLSVLRRKLAARLVSVKNETAMLTTFNEVDMSEIFRLRKLYKEEFTQKHGVGLGFMSFFTKAVTRALKLYPDVNAAIDGDQKINYDFCDISVAVSGPKGLMVPIIRDAETLSFKGIELKIKDLATKVRDGNISVDEMTGGTFTITNGGTFGSMLSTPIINPPQSAILGMHNILERPVAVNGQVEIRPMMYLALSYDHRIIDGRESVGFLVAVKEAIENPVELLMENNEKKALEL
jgi:dihydrolipoyllysine-residue succinyltransferase, E2 component of oxoglutarate dehydrogenase (succinyl-transferring) complex